MPYKVNPFYNVQSPVGPYQTNEQADVTLVQYFLVKIASKTAGIWTPPGTPLALDGIYTPNLGAWILSYQKVVQVVRDGIVSPQRNPHWVTYGTIVSMNASY